MPNRLIPDDEDFWALLERGEEPLLLQLAVAEDGERDSDQPYRLPVPIAGRVALAPYHRVQEALAQQRRQPQRRLLGPDGRYEHLPLLLVDLPGEDLDVLDGALQAPTLERRQRVQLLGAPHRHRQGLPLDGSRRGRDRGPKPVTG
jgi:hypothetical protein